MRKNARHGGPYDRGSADAYYRRKFAPHYFLGDTYSSKMIEGCDMTADELIEYEAGWNDAHAEGNYKEY